MFKFEIQVLQYYKYESIRAFLEVELRMVLTQNNVNAEMLGNTLGVTMSEATFKMYPFFLSHCLHSRSKSVKL